MREYEVKLVGNLTEDIRLPAFYDKIANLLGYQITQAPFFIDKTQYSYEDQFMCMVDGSADLRLVPHVHRLAMYAGASSTTFDSQKGVQKTVTNAKNESPVNLFKMDK